MLAATMEFSLASGVQIIVILLCLDGATVIGDHDAEKEAALTGQILVQGDMLMSPEQHHVTYELNMDDPRSFAGAALESERSRWRGGVNPYTIDDGVSHAVRNNFKWAAGIWNKNTCIRILPAGSKGTEGTWGSIKVSVNAEGD